MKTSAEMRDVTNSMLFRWFGRISGIMLFLGCAAMFVADWPRQELVWESSLQGMALAIVFAGYAAGWKNEMLGGVMSVMGTVIFVAICGLTANIVPRPETVWFAAPGVSYLLAWHFGRVEKSENSHETE